MQGLWKDKRKNFLKDKRKFFNSKRDGRLLESGVLKYDRIYTRETIIEEPKTYKAFKVDLHPKEGESKRIKIYIKDEYYALQPSVIDVSGKSLKKYFNDRTMVYRADGNTRIWSNDYLIVLIDHAEDVTIHPKCGSRCVEREIYNSNTKYFLYGKPFHDHLKWWVTGYRNKKKYKRIYHKRDRSFTRDFISKLNSSDLTQSFQRHPEDDYEDYPEFLYTPRSLEWDLF